MEEKNTPLVKAKERYIKRAENLNATADAALTEPIDQYRACQEATIANAEEVAEEAYKEAEEKAAFVAREADRKAAEALLVAYTQFGVRK
ncbi:MAG: hypothetical protein K6B65_04315 [Bacilli bacterium]|nr:hypothetical protein [Bacilli bacterium]